MPRMQEDRIEQWILSTRERSSRATAPRAIDVKFFDRLRRQNIPYFTLFFYDVPKYSIFLCRVRKYVNICNNLPACDRREPHLACQQAFFVLLQVYYDIMEEYMLDMGSGWSKIHLLDLIFVENALYKPPHQRESGFFLAYCRNSCYNWSVAGDGGGMEYRTCYFHRKSTNDSRNFEKVLRFSTFAEFINFFHSFCTYKLNLYLTTHRTCIENVLSTKYTQKNYLENVLRGWCW